MYNGIENITICDHPLIKHKLTMIRDKKTGTNEFRAIVEEIAMFSKQGYNYGLGVRTGVGSACGRLIAPGEFGWDGAAGSFILMDPDEEISIMYTQHRRNPHANEFHPRIRNIVYAELVK